MPNLFSKFIFNIGVCGAKKNNDKGKSPVVIQRRPKRVPSLTTIEDNKLYQNRLQEKERNETRAHTLFLTDQDEHPTEPNRSFEHQLSRTIHHGYNSGSPNSKAIIV